MGTFLGRQIAAVAASAVAFSTVVVGSTMGAAQAADVTFKGSLKGSDGAAASGVFVALCASDCLRNGAVVAGGFTTAAGAFTATKPAPAGTYAIAVDDVDRIAGYNQTAGSGYLHREPEGQWSVTQNFAAATKVPVSAASLALSLAKGIHNPQDRFTQTTKGTGSYLPCAGHATTFKPTPFSDMPTNGTVAYQWYAGATRSTIKPIGGARGTSYTPPATLTGLGLYVSMIASAPNRTSYDRLGSLGKVGNPLNCRPSLATIAKSWVKSYGKKHGKVKAGKRVSVVGAKAKSKKKLKISYTWMINGRPVGASRKFTIPKTAKRQKLTVKVTFSRPGFKARAKVIRFGKIK